MKREEIIEHFRKLSREAAAEAEECEGDYGISGGPEDGARDAFDHAAAFIEQHLPANTITLQLPTYAPGDPKAGEVVEEGDHVWTIKQPWEIAYWIVDGFVVNGGAMLPYMMVRRSGTSLEKTMMPATGPYYSTADARDAALAAAKEAAKEAAE